ncbi:DNA replication complex subunit Gins51 [Halorarum salinum]|uniref:Gins51 C-terminal domain-containing protein n=1 Tax=Halorarum salinum TaxID=2743089 RepID=A0A7D5QL72_9EURY|nr:hypothetical protein [Halobaculum salinum]QLG62625.1 hypothetical protein HUG12_13185 [Halobaculum salinum]
MDLDELRGVQSTERGRDSLQHLRDSFYEDVAAYIAGRKRRRDERAASVDNPFSDERVRKLSDEIETAEEVAESLYERRVGKVVKLASFAAADAPVETEGMTAEEADLFDDLVERIEANKGNVLEVLGGGADVELDAPADGSDDGPGSRTADERDATAGGGAEPEASTPDSDAGDVLADAMGGAEDRAETTGAADEGAPHPSGGPEPTEAPSDEPDPSAATRGDPAAADAGPEPAEDRTTVRITRDVGEILGVDDREYDLESEDVVTLPAANADPLVDRDAAEPLE